MESEIPGPVDLPLQAPDAPPATKKLTLKHILAYAIGNFPAGLVLLVVETWLMRLYCPSPDETGRTLLVSPKAFGRLFIVVLIIGAIADPLVGFFSDRTRSRFGRRLPYIFLGTPLLALSFVLMWFPPVNAESFTNVLWLTGTLIGVHVFFTVVVNPYLALMPELWTSEVDRVKVSAWMSGANVLAQVFAFGLLGWLITRFEGGVHLGGFLIADGYKIGALVAGVVTVAFFLPLMIGIRETPHHASKEVPFGLVKASLETLKNPAFVPYIIAGSMLGAAQVLIVTVIPYMVSVFLGESDDFAGAMLTGLVVLSAVMFPFAEMASEKFRKKTLFMASLIAFMVLLPATTMIGLLPASVDAPFMPDHVLNVRLLGLAVSLALIAPFLALALVIPRAILGDIMDYDTQRTGFRREAMYNGMEGFIQKVAMAFAPWAVGELFDAYGFSAEHPTGIVLAGVAGGVMSLLAVVAFSFYPLKK